MAIIGIDLGTTRSLVAMIDDLGRPQIIHNSEGDNLTPSVVYFKSSTQTIVGKNAKMMLDVNEPNVFKEFKREMGSHTTYPCHGKAITPTDLSTLVLKKIKQDFEKVVGPADSIVISVPANFRNEAREATLAAAHEAGLNTDLLINEPTAAALYYAHRSGKQLNGIYVVHDLGGGTLDISVIKAKGEDIEVLSSEGVQKLGGKDFDQKIMDLVASKFKKQVDKEFKSSDYGFGYNEAEELKKSLSSLEEKKVRIVGQDIPPTVISVTRKEFEEAISSYLAQIEMICEAALVEANIKVSEVTDVFLAGGSSRIPIVQRMLSKFFGKKLDIYANPDEAIALGAAIYAGYKTHKSKLNTMQAQAIKGMRFQEVAPAYFGTISLDAEKLSNGIRCQLNSIIINKNEKIPCSQKDTFYTIADDQAAVNCIITQSPNQETDPRFVRVIWDGKLDIPPRPRGQAIDITYSYSENGIMHAEFLDVASGRKTEIDISSKSIGSETTININDFLVE